MVEEVWLVALDGAYPVCAGDIALGAPALELWPEEEEADDADAISCWAEARETGRKRNPKSASVVEIERWTGSFMEIGYSNGKGMAHL